MKKWRELKALREKGERRREKIKERREEIREKEEEEYRKYEINEIITERLCKICSGITITIISIIIFGLILKYGNDCDISKCFEERSECGLSIIVGDAVIKVAGALSLITILVGAYIIYCGITGNHKEEEESEEWIYYAQYFGMTTYM